MTLSHTGNTSGATIPVALDQFNREGWLGPGAMVALPDGGGGMAWGAALLSWVETPAGRAARAGLDELIDLTAGPVRGGGGRVILLILSLLVIGAVTGFLALRD